MTKLLTSLATISILISAMLYTNSVAYYGGYFSAFNLDSDILFRNTDQVIYHGFLLTLPKSLSFLMILVIFTAFLFITIVIYLLAFKYRKAKNVTLKKDIFKYSGKSLTTFLSFWVLWAFGLLVVVSSYLLFLVSIETEGKNEANTLKTKIATGEKITLTCASSEYIVKTGYNSIINIFCGANLCVGSTKDFDEFIYFDPKNSSFKRISGTNCNDYKSEINSKGPISHLKIPTQHPALKSVNEKSEEEAKNHEVLVGKSKSNI
ncbi:hypothetical protein [Vibrio fluvialis]|uniref:hypothetical protein n=1 Tax=Vibrio fluvialis TaxID=676 RepID=UPI001C9D39D3|nr:hypothetical protein [Vibrio fluvialis]EKO3380827.1 hypothetical protein [Vibrio fluvialis]MBY8033111.1 hypothetical protein [Vibrio fluvialis]MBY8038564.1 hypothetical protein [Vibrio fluvialis]MBY8192503.1 hypothetical protein [Vibrio fluvialis]MDZ5513815.1 hypothetical protein [Vibrio fluvialis]